MNFDGKEEDLFTQHLDLFACPACGGALRVPEAGESLKCVECSQAFEIHNGIPLLFWPNDWDVRTDVTEIVKSFYEENPFPSYEDLDSSWSLRKKAERGVFARLLDAQLSHGAKILEVGCGTGQLSNYLGTTWGRTVFGADMCLNSLSLGQAFKEKNQIANTAFLQMNLFRPAFRLESFDLVICNGVLHHTGDPLLGFQSINRLVKKGGFIVIGLYNTYGRLSTDFRRAIFRMTGNRMKSLDPRLRSADVGEVRKHMWFMDQYKNPHESKHTIGEVQEWFDETSVDFVNSIPKADFSAFTPDEELFTQGPPGTRVDHFLAQLGMVLSGGREGGFFTMIGQKR